jgi:hypothetical protein
MKHSTKIGAIAVIAGFMLVSPAVSQTVVLPPDLSTTSATPIEIPGKGRVMLPAPIPKGSVDRFDPRKMPEYFMGMPIPLSRNARSIGRFDFIELNDGGVFGNTPFGYARFYSLEEYQLFLRKHPPKR